MRSYTVLNSSDLINRAPNVRENYKKNNPARQRIISIFEAIIDSLRFLDEKKNTLSDDQLQTLLFSAWIYCAAAIEIKKGWLESLGSLHHILSTQLEIKDLNKINTFDKLSYLSKLFHFIKAKKELFEIEFKTTNVKVNAFCNELIEIMRALLKLEYAKTANSLKALPHEAVLDQKMQSLPSDYEEFIVEKAKNAYFKTTHDPYHKFLAELIAAISQLVSADDKTKDKSFLTRSERIKLGIVLYMMRSIYDGYKARSAHNSGAYSLGYQLLNENDLDCIDLNIQSECLATCHNFLDSNNIKALEEIMKNGYINKNIFRVKDEMGNMIKASNCKPAMSASAVTIGAAALGGLLAAAPGYGVGWTIGYIASEMNNTLETKVKVSQLTGQVMTVMYGSKGQCLSYFVSNMVVDVALERSFAKIFELFGILLGAGIGAGIGIIIHDVSYKTLRDLCKSYLVLQPSIQPNLARNIDQDILDCLLELPAEVFEDEHKNRLRAITNQGIFQPKQEKEQAFSQDKILLDGTSSDDEEKISGTLSINTLTTGDDEDNKRHVI